MTRIVIIGNSGGGKSTLARGLAARRGVPYFEIDRFLWHRGWQWAPIEDYNAEHARLIRGEAWLLDGIGSFESIAGRLARATEIVLVDLPLWLHFALAAERQIAYALGRIEHPPAGETQMPPTRGLFENMWRIDQDWMPEIRRLVDGEAARSKIVTRLEDLAALDEFASRRS
jgi:adenylate kinase family enzyme